MIIERNDYLRKLIDRRENGRIKVITGIRRCGKSVLLLDIYGNYLRNSGVRDEQIVTLRLDISLNARYRNPMELDKYLRERLTDSGLQYYVMLDEIQEVKDVPNPWLEGETIGFVDVLLGLLDLKNVDIYVTGSNSKMLASDIMTEFKDRGDEIHVWPFTFREFCGGFEGDKALAWQEFITYGGLPRILFEKTDEDKSRYLHELMQKTYLTDVIERNHLKNDIAVLDDLLDVVASFTGSLTSPLKLENTFASVKGKKISDSTISLYLGFFAEAYILHKSRRYDIQGRKYIGSPVKYYFTDVGLRNAQLNFRQQEEDHIMENVLYNEISVRGFNVDVGIVEYNFKNADGKNRRSSLEIDFVVNKGNRRCYIQSAFGIPNAEKRLQETRPLRNVSDSFRKIVVLRDRIKPWYDESGIYFIGIEDFLLSYVDELYKSM